MLQTQDAFASKDSLEKKDSAFQTASAPPPQRQKLPLNLKHVLRMNTGDLVVTTHAKTAWFTSNKLHADHLANQDANVWTVIAEMILVNASQRLNVNFLDQVRVIIRLKNISYYYLFTACKKNESLMCSNGCPEKTCTPNKAVCLGPPTKPDCKKTCQCDSGYVKHQGVCVLQSKCPGSQACGVNEEFTNCKNACNSCQVLTGRYPCDPLPYPQCGSGCDCKSGYRRHSDGRCVLPEQCPKPFQSEQLVSMKAM